MMKMKRRTHRKMTKIATLMGLVNWKSLKNLMRRKRKRRRRRMKMMVTKAKSRKYRRRTQIAALTGLVSSKNWNWNLMSWNLTN